jgi:methylated-DNA-[protein]-cysteine S-methyltransferase
MEYIQYIDTPQGHLLISASQQGVTSVNFVEERETAIGQPAENKNPITEEAARQLTAYFNKTLMEFDLPLEAKGTQFQHKVWQALLQIPYGETASYLDIANAIGNPKAVRAVGMANGRNPIAIVVPCHRIIGSNKALTGYAGGLPRKQFLLNLEGAQGVLWQ